MTIKVMADETVYHPPSGRTIYKNHKVADRRKLTGYYELVRKKVKLPMLPYSVSSSKMTSPVVTCSKYSSWRYINVYNSMPTISPPTEAYTHSNAKAIENFYSNAKSFESQLAVTAAEFPKTVTLIKDSATRLFNVYKKLKRFDVYGAVKALGLDVRSSRELELIRKLNKSSRNFSRKTGRNKFAESAWLELQYGWKPLLSEVSNAMSDFEKAAEVSSVWLTVRSASSRSGTHDSANFGYEPSKGITDGSSYKITTGYVAYFEVNSGVLHNVTSLGLLNIASVGWELVPFSFVVDWFVPIGDWLNSLDALSGVTFRYGCKSVKEHNVVNYRYPAGAIAYRYQGNWLMDEDAVLIRMDDAFTRTVITQPPAAIDMFRVNPLKKVFSVTHSISAIALISSVLK
jgi:hypothetical protein